MDSFPFLRALKVFAVALLVVGLAACGNDDVDEPAAGAARPEVEGQFAGPADAAEEDSFAATPSTAPQTAPDFMLQTLSGEPFHLGAHRGEVVLLNFWATWCAPCRVEIPDLIELQEEYGDEGLQIVGVSLDAEGFEVVRPFAEEAGFNYPIVVDIGEVAEMYGGIYALPTTVIIDREGQIVHVKAGMVTREELEPMLEELLAS